jgi:hypothetical protein
MKKLKSILLILFFWQPNLLSAQAISTLVPNSGNAGQSLTISITGNNTHFTSGSNVLADFEFAQGSSTTGNINVLSWTNIEADVNIPSQTTTGYYDLYAHNTFDGDIHSDRAFFVNGTPQRYTISPAGANPGQTLIITITGSNTHFNSGSTSAHIYLDFGQASGTTYLPGNVTVGNDTLMAAQFTIPAVVAPAYYSMYVYNGQDGQMIAPNSISIPSTLGINENTSNPISFSAFPNPYVDRVILTTELKKSSPLEIELFTSGGKKVFEKLIENVSPGKFSFELPVKELNLADDVYFVKCKAGINPSVIKLIHLH